MTIQTSGDGRTLAVLFTCSRCRAKTILPYEECMKGETYGYLHNSTLPEGWEYQIHGPLLCPKCAEEYHEFMRGAK